MPGDSNFNGLCACLYTHTLVNILRKIRGIYRFSIVNLFAFTEDALYSTEEEAPDIYKNQIVCK